MAFPPPKGGKGAKGGKPNPFAAKGGGKPNPFAGKMKGKKKGAPPMKGGKGC